MLLRRLFERARTRSSGDTNKQTCLCTTAKRDSFYDDLPRPSHRANETQSTDHYGFFRSDKPRRLIRQTGMDESDGDDDLSIGEKLRRASSQSPANIPMLVVVSFKPDTKGLQKGQIEIQRGYPVNAQFIVNEWLFVKTADNEEGFVPYVCCRPMLRRPSLRQSNDLENLYKPYDFESNKAKSPSTSIPTLSPSSNKKFSFSSTLGSQSFLFQNSFSCKKRQDITSSSCGGDSGFSDCESSSHNHHYHSFDLPTQRYTRLSNIRSLRSSSNAWKKSSALSQETPNKKSIKTNQMINSKTETSSRVKSQLSVSTNSAFTQVVKKNLHQNPPQDSNQQQVLQSNSRLFPYQPQVEVSSSSINNLRRPYNSYDGTRHLSSPTSKCGTSSLSSPYIRRTPFARRSLPHQPVLKKSVQPVLSSSSPDPFKVSQKKEQQLRHVVLAEPALPPAMIPLKSSIERQFSDLSLNQIENDSLTPSRAEPINYNHPLLSCSSSATSSSSSASSSASSTDESTTAFIHIQMNNSKCDVLHRGDSIPLVFSSTNNDLTATKSTSFIHNVSITV